MKNYTPEERNENILKRAIEIGFIPSCDNPVKLLEHAKGYIYEYDEDQLKVICDITTEGETQHLVWDDGMGYTYKASGELITTDWWKYLDTTEAIIDFAINSEGRLVAFFQKRTFDVMYINGDTIDDIIDEKFHESYIYCLQFIRKYNGTDTSHFPGFRGGRVVIYCYEAEEEVYEEEIR